MLSIREQERPVLVFDGSLEGLLTAVFVAYADKMESVDIKERTSLQLRLGQREIEIKSDEALAERVQKGISRTCGANCFDAVKYVYLSDDPHKGTIIHDFIRYAMVQNHPFDCGTCKKRARCNGLCTRTRTNSILDNVAHESVRSFASLHKAVSAERHRIMQFLRFEHVDGDLWFARCNPNASVIPLVMDWFAARFNTQPFLIYDEAHALAGVYEGGDWYLVDAGTITVPDHSDEEKQMQQAWKRFYRTVAVEARYNPELRRQFMPKRLWRNIVEMHEDIPSRQPDQTPVPSKAGMKALDAASPDCQ